MSLLLYAAAALTLGLVYVALSLKRRGDWIKQHSSVPVDIEYALFMPWSTMSVLLPRIPFVNLTSLRNYISDFSVLFQRAKTGTVVTLSPFATYVASRDGAFLKEALLTHRKSLVKPAEFYDGLDIYGKNIITTEGAEWLHHRKVIQPAFSDDGLRYLANSISRLTGNLIQTIKSKPTDLVEITRTSRRLTLEVICDAGFGYDLDAGQEKQGKSLVHVVERVSAMLELNFLLSQPVIDRVPLQSFREHSQNVALFKSYIEEMIALRKKEGDTGRKDLLTLMLLANDQEENGLLLSELIADCFIFLFAGHETTTNAILWSLASLAFDQEKQAKVLEELSEFEAGESFTFEDYRHLRYTEAVVKEALRLFPPVPIVSKRATESVVVNGLALPQGAYLDCMIYFAHYNEAHWANPETFLPERFLDESASEDALVGFMPFSRGPRSCVGFRFALIEATIAVASLVRQFHVQPRDGDHKATTLVMEPSLLIKPKNEILLKFTPRV